jgi:hypothetical protein
MVTMSGYKYLKRVYGLFCCKSPAESIELRWSYINNHVNDVYSGGSESQICRRSSIHISLHRHGILAANRCGMHLCTIVEHRMTVSMSLRSAQRRVLMERQRFIVIPIHQSPGCIVASIQ